jgi:hypothetical protein
MKAGNTKGEAQKEGSKLKGVFWPGMDLFDSATVEMKRMRNQKKDETTLQQMKRSSAGIEPAEWVFNVDGEFRKVRDIFDESTESSPVSLSSNGSLSMAVLLHHPGNMQSNHHITPRL